MVDTRLPCTTVHFLVSRMLRCNQADTSSWSDSLIEKRGFILLFLWNEKQLYPSHGWLVFSMVSEAASKTGADLVGHLYCSGSLRWTTLKFLLLSILNSHEPLSIFHTFYLKYLEWELFPALNHGSTIYWDSFETRTPNTLHMFFTERWNLPLDSEFVIAWPITHRRDTMLRF